jgi:branched-chain amino acid aminotransferase
MNSSIRITMTSNPKEKPNSDNLGFGKYFTDHMFIMNYTEGKGWHDPEIIPYGPLQLDPSTMVFHYGQSVFEGLKAFMGIDGKVRLFRPRNNMERLNISDERLCIPFIDPDFGVEAIKTLVALDRSWIPSQRGTSLYVRPFMIATDPFIGVRPSSTYKFIIILSPVGNYYPQGINPVKIFVENKYVRAVKGGLGFTKAAANYAASLKSQEEAHAAGYVQVLWLDGVERKYIEEVGTMNVFFKIKNRIITPALEGSILPGITRSSAIDILKDCGYDVVERKLGIEEVFKANEAGELEEAFGTGTAAVISPVGELNWKNNTICINNGEIGEVSKKIYDTITGIQYGEQYDKFNWTVEVK